MMYEKIPNAPMECPHCGGPMVYSMSISDVLLKWKCPSCGYSTDRNLCSTCRYRGRPTYKSPCSECSDSDHWEEENETLQINRVQRMSLKELAQFLYRVNHSLEKALSVDDFEAWLSSNIE